MASDIIESGAWKCPYRYVVVDEYQDLSRSRYRLLGSMRDSHWFSLFCVGDDWQSIYRFNRSDIGYILGFERYWGPSEICRIETTYRFSGTLLAASNRFMNSSGRQIHKVLRSGSAGETDLRIIRADNQSSCAAAISREMRDMPMGQTVIMLGRYRHDVVTLDGGEFKWSPEIGGNTFRVVCHSRPDLDIRFMTIHGSKGLEADAVFVLNNRKGPGGFPSMKPGVILERLLLESDEQPLDEERRLFYVAITRARKCAYLVTVNGMESRFIEEMSKSERRCPRCGGKLVLRKGPYGNFYGCSNYRKGCTYTQKP